LQASSDGSGVKFAQGIYGPGLYRLGQEIMEDKIKKIEREIKRLKKLPDYEYVIMDLKQEKKELKKLQASSSKLQA
jgi:hypothetical protein